ncbi:MAG: hypothetical protein Sylvanvirus13_21 [Sylvanvirus sp.]|uniref:Uncharacterized protein n=1 Tax=Sylvanvirus sp. TaxID=2487774 RepID=A0A3G5AJK0_9VIRU|nr:MAG: hypothetical protein Sylvanvirus13_21 [Sylvanvirus sp.]
MSHDLKEPIPLELIDFDCIPTAFQSVLCINAMGESRCLDIASSSLALYCESGLDGVGLSDLYSSRIKDIGCPYCFVKFHVRVPFQIHSISKIENVVRSWFRGSKSFIPISYNPDMTMVTKREQSHGGASESSLVEYMKAHIKHTHTTLNLPFHEEFIKRLYDDMAIPREVKTFKSGDSLPIPPTSSVDSSHPSRTTIVIMNMNDSMSI